jgi:hypothetical protein
MQAHHTHTHTHRRNSPHSVVKDPVTCGHELFSVSHVTLIHMYINYIQGLCQSRPATADHALTHVPRVTTAAQSIERSYAWPSPTLSLLYFLCRASPLPMSRTLTFSWFCMISASCLNNFSYVILNIRYLESRMQIADLCAPWKFASGAENFVLQALQFQKVDTCR